jgi:hypothetical protein
MDSLDLQDLKVVNADDENPLAPTDFVSDDPATVVSQAQPVEAPKPAKGTTVKLLSGTVRTDY